MSSIDEQDLYNDYAESPYDYKKTTQVLVYPNGPKDETLEYIINGIVHHFRDIPCDAEVLEVIRQEWGEDGVTKISSVEVPFWEWGSIQSIIEEAKRKMVEEW